MDKVFQVTQYKDLKFINKENVILINGGLSLVEFAKLYRRRRFNNKGEIEKTDSTRVYIRTETITARIDEMLYLTEWDPSDAERDHIKTIK